MTETTFSISGMSCGACAAKVEEAVRSLQGVQAVDANFVLARAVVKYDAGLIGPRVIRHAIQRLGFAATELQDGVEIEVCGARRRRIMLVAAVGVLLGLAWAMQWVDAVPRWAVIALAGLATVLGGCPIVIKAARSAIRLELNVDALVAIAASAAVITGYYLEAGIVVFILLLGELLEEVTVAKTAKAIQGLASLLPDTVTVKRGDDECEVPTSSLAVGDIIIFRSGERIAVDGVVLAGAASVDQSLVTGESVPVEKAAGDNVHSGTINQIGAIEVRATKVGKDTTVAKIKAMIAEAQAKKAKVQRFVDRFAAHFVPAMLVVALAVYLLTWDIQRAITILIVACPCAFVLGTPTAVVAAIGAAARRGIVIRGGDVLETLAKVNGVVFDKTGTLTRGRPQVTDIKRICGHPEQDVLRLAAVAERLSEHPLAGAVLDKAKEWDLAVATPDHFEVKRGQGVEVRHDGLWIVLGNRRLLAENGIPLPPGAESYMADRERQGQTVLVVAHDRQVCGLVSLADPTREEAPAAIASLRTTGMGRRIAMYTGDDHRTASSIAGPLGIAEVAAGLLPEDKVGRIKALCGKGHTVAMVGDGINDAPALATADVGIAMGVAGSDIAAQAAKVVLLSDDLTDVPAAIRLGRKTLNVIQQNLIFALVFNASMVFLASAGAISMVLGAVCHQASSLLVISNSMRLLLAMKRRPVTGGNDERIA